MTRFGMFRNTSVIKAALVPTTPTRESARLCDTLAIITHQEDQRSHAIAPVLLSLSDKHLRCLTVVYSCIPFSLPSPLIPLSKLLRLKCHLFTSLTKLLASVFTVRKIIDAKKGNVHLAF